MAIVPSGFFDHVHEDPSHGVRDAFTAIVDGRTSVERLDIGKSCSTTGDGRLVERQQVVGRVVLRRVHLPVTIVIKRSAGPRLNFHADKPLLKPRVFNEGKVLGETRQREI